jgi:hypothetical protein
MRFASDFSHVEALKTTKPNASRNHRRLEVQPRRDVEGPHQFRTRNDAIEAQQTRSKSNKTVGKSTEVVDISPLITVWLHHVAYRSDKLIRRSEGEKTSEQGGGQHHGERVLVDEAATPPGLRGGLAQSRNSTTNVSASVSEI